MPLIDVSSVIKAKGRGPRQEVEASGKSPKQEGGAPGRREEPQAGGRGPRQEERAGSYSYLLDECVIVDLDVNVDWGVGEGLEHIAEQRHAFVFSRIAVTLCVPGPQKS